MKILKLLIRILVVIALIGVGVLVYQTCSGSSIIQKIDKSVPDSALVPYQVTTRTHLYMAKEAAQNSDGSVTISGWYERENNRWILQKSELTIPTKLKPKINGR